MRIQSFVRGTAVIAAAAAAFSVQAAEYPIGKQQIQGGMEIGAVYLQPITMEPEGMMRKASDSDVHLESDIHAVKNNPVGFAEGDWMPYGDRITDSMRRAIDETERRRAKQIAFNEENGIVPRGVVKRIKDIIDGVYNVDDARAELREEQERARFEDMSEKQIAKEIKKLEKQMMDYAKNLEFEKAAQTRDQLAVLRQRVFGANVGDHPA